MRKHRVVKYFIDKIDQLYSIAAQFLFSITSFVLTFVLAKHLNVELYSVFVVAISIGLIIEGLFRFMCIKPLNVDGSAEIYKKSWGGVVIIGLLILVFVFFFGGIVAHFLGVSPEQYLLAGLFSVFYCSFSSWRIWLNKFFTSFHVMLLNVAYLGAILIWWLGVQFDIVPTFSVFYILFFIVVLMVGSFVIVVARIPKEFDLKFVYSKYSIPRVANGIFASIFYSGYNHLPLILLSYISEPASAGLFFIARTLTQPLMAILRGIEIIDQKKIALLVCDGTHTGVRILMAKYIRKNILLCLCVTLVSFSVGIPFVGFYYAGQYEISYLIALPWMFYSLLVAISKPIESFAFVISLQRCITQGRGYATLVCVLSLFPLVKFFGVAGSVMAVCLGWFVADCYVWIAVNKQLKASERS